MQFLLAKAANPGGKFHPRHLVQLCSLYGADRVEWVDDLVDVSHGDWALVIRAPSTQHLSAPLVGPPGKASVSVFNQLSREETTALQTKRGLLLLDMGWEALFCHASLAHDLHAALKAADIDPGRVRILHSNLAGAALEAEWCRHYPSSAPKSLAYPVGFAVGAAHQQAQTPRSARDQRLQRAASSLRDRSKDKTFNSFNGEARPNRLFFLAYLDSQGVLDDALVSMLGYRKGTASLNHGAMESDILASARGPNLRERVAEALPRTLARLPMTLDVQADRPDSIQSLEVLAFSSPDPSFYDRTHFSVVLDTLFLEDDMRFVTEKIMKPIMNASPFVYVGNTGAHRTIEALGFETFSAAVDETYFAVDQPKERFGVALEEIVRLARLSKNDLYDLNRTLWPSVVSNYEHFWTGLPAVLEKAFNEDVLDGM